MTIGKLKKVTFMSIGSRLREERLRLQMSQTDFASIAGASKGAVMKWEKDTSAPTAVALAAFANAGVNIPYVLTGETGEVRRIGAADRVLATIGTQISSAGSLEPVDEAFIDVMFAIGKNSEKTKAFTAASEFLGLQLSKMSRAQAMSMIENYGVPPEDLVQFIQSISTDTAFEVANRRREVAEQG